MTELSLETKDSPKPDKGETVEHLMQGWSEADRKLFYETSQGSRLVPINWYKNLEQADSQKPFNDRGLLDDKLGYLFPANSNDKDQFPIGFVIDNRDTKPVATPDDKSRLPRLTDVSPAIPNEKWLGMTCAACHTGQIEFKGQAKRIDGAPGNSDFTGLTVSLRDAFKSTLADADKFKRFADKVLPGGTAEQQAELKKNVEQYTSALDELAKHNLPLTPFGHGRLDAFALFLNEITGTAMDKPQNYRVPDAPVSIPAVWGAPNLDWVQWNGSANSPLGRNVGEVLGGFAGFDLKAGSPHFSDSTVDLKNQYALEGYLKKLDPPKWPDSFGKLDQSAVDNGRKLFESAGCQSCHGTSPAETYKNKYGRQLSKTNTVPLSVVKTDPTMAMNFVSRKADPGAFKDSLGGKDEVPIAALLGLAVGAVTKSEFQKENVTTPQEMLKMNDYREDINKTGQELAGYKAPSLEGVWATAPYLHNGSVPTLYDLLQPPEKRPSRFMVGSRDYDPAKVGFVSDKGKSEIDTHLKGNSNQGHDFGTTLSEKEKMDLIEYLKSR